MILDDVETPTHHEKTWDFGRTTWGVGVDWCSWALPVWGSVGPMNVRRTEGGWKRFWGVIVQVGPFYVGVSW